MSHNFFAYISRMRYIGRWSLMRNALPEELRGTYESLLYGRDAEELHDIVKAADKLSAYIKCIEERKAGNREFLSAEEQTRRAIEEMHLPEADWFMEHCLGAFEKNLDELGTM